MSTSNRSELSVIAGLLLFLLAIQGPQAKEGFSLNLGLGGGMTDFELYSVEDSDPSIQSGEWDGHCFAGRLSLDYNIKGYVSFELGVSVQGSDLLEEKIFGGGQATLAVLFHPVYAWLPEFPLDVYLLAGGGVAMVYGRPDEEGADRRLRGGCAEVGLGAAWFFTDYFGLGLSYRAVLPFYDRWSVDYHSRDAYRDKSTPHAYIHSFFLTTTFHYSPVD